MSDRSAVAGQDDYARTTAYGGDTSPAAVAARLRASTEVEYARAANATRETAGRA